jgi:hypothetical protein
VQGEEEQRLWIPAFAGMTANNSCPTNTQGPKKKEIRLKKENA